MLINIKKQFSNMMQLKMSGVWTHSVSVVSFGHIVSNLCRLDTLCQRCVVWTHCVNIVSFGHIVSTLCRLNTLCQRCVVWTHCVIVVTFSHIASLLCNLNTLCQCCIVGLLCIGNEAGANLMGNTAGRDRH